jgi:hypothetical protein
MIVQRTGATKYNTSSKSVTNILGLDFKEIKPKIDFIPKERPILEKYITIANESTAGLKLWNLKGWQELVNYLNLKGYKVINVSKMVLILLTYPN